MRSRLTFAKSYAILVLSIALVAAGPALLLLGIGVPAIRNNYWMSIALTGSGGALAIAHALARRAWIAWILGSAAGAAAAGLIIILLLAIRVPSGAGVPRAGDHARDFTLTDAHGAPARLSDIYKSDPVLLVFFRGTW
ncbi:MAG: redoxin domain-containing protein [Planctomycetes bacterium]|nr:redoxin domain-containing protein [Planctomycetota bacterium]